MDDLVAFLNARLDEDEAVAKGLAGATRFIGKEPDFYGTGGPAADAFWKHFNPVRELREVAAKRRMVGDTWGGPDHEDMWLHHMHLLADIWSDHPDYRAEWKP